MAGTGALLDLWGELAEYRTLADGLRKGYHEQAVFGLQPGQGVFLLAALARDLGRPLLLLTPGYREAVDLAGSMAPWLPRVDVFPPLEVVPYHVVARSPEVESQRLAVLSRLRDPDLPAVVAPVGALLRPLPDPRDFQGAALRLAPGRALDPAAAVARLVAGGYERVDRVEAPGQFSLRGGILDVFPLTAERPCRAEFWGDEVASLRLFDPQDQRSVEEAGDISLPPAREVVVPEDAQGPALARVREELAQAAARLQASGRAAATRELRERVEGHLSAPTPAIWELYAPYLKPGQSPSTLLDYFPTPPLIGLWEAPRALESVEGAHRQWQERIASLLESGRLLPSQEGLQLAPDLLRGRLKKGQVLYFSGLPHSLPGTELRHVVTLAGKSIPSFRGQWDLFVDELKGWLGQRYRVCLASSQGERAGHLATSLKEAGVFPQDGRTEAPHALPAAGQVAVWESPLGEGFVFPALRLAVVPEEAIFGRRPARPAKAAKAGPKPEAGARIASYQDLRVGDFVVHVHHGIGQYLGIKTLEVQGVQRDYLFLKYEGADRLYVPTEQIHLVQKYVGGEGKSVRLYKLGGNEWSRVKQRVKESVRQMAEELLQLYAARQALEGFAFPPDTPWQREFEDAFPYDETRDQLQATAEIKADMEQSRPMDRLLCGDVGFGKTEVAMRAAFKAVMGGKQVAVLVPTTLLAQQHHQSFTERFHGFPVKIDVLSRFRTAKEQVATIDALRKGEVDIVIGTHRLFQGDVNFKDLGLLIVDEEHRFGVAHKEALKRLRANVDVLTLTATPIPRTLHMSLAGMRDMSVIETPPENRFPVETYVVEFDDGLVRDAIERETSRGGQVFYVHNRVQGIPGAMRRLEKLAPGARVGIAHGQMPEDDLEEVMVDFLAAHHDILLCTSIIESGLDIANANTLVVEDSDHFGLAQLYQIRGRVGRSHRLAYAYFTYRRDKVLNEVAQKRLEAIKEFTELGSGFKIAMRDLEIRGAGNILGPEQHGFIVSVGFDLYCQLLEEAVRELKGDKLVPRTEPAVELTADAYLSDGYIPEARAKIEVYKKINAVATLEEAAEVEAELKDRYGPLPPPVQNLLTLARIKVRAAQLGILSATEEREGVRLVFAGYMKEMLRVVEGLRPKYARRLLVQLAPRPSLRFKLEGRRPAWAAPRDAGDGGAATLTQVAGLLDDLAGLPEVQRWLASS